MVAVPASWQFPLQRYSLEVGGWILYQVQWR